MKNLRKEPRYPLKDTVQAINSINGRSLGILVNLSAGGFMLMCGKDAPRKGDILQMHLLDIRNHVLDIMVGATCVWREEASATDSYWCGFKFIDVSSEARERLDHYLERLREES